MEIPGTRYASTADGDSVAFQVVGDGPFDLIFVPGFISHVELTWAEPSIARFYERLASFSRLILFDKRGTGLSDPIEGPQTLEERMLDVRAVLDAAGSENAAVMGLSEGSAMAAVFAASHPERTRALVLCGPIVGGPIADHPAGERWSRACERFTVALERWGEGVTLPLLAPSSRATARQLGLLERAGASPRMARALIAMWLQLDLSDVLPAIRVPTLVVHRRDEIFPHEAAREVAGRIPGARDVELSGADHVPWAGDMEAYVAEIEEFLTGARAAAHPDRVLRTLLVTDVVDSTGTAARVGDDAWRELMSRHDSLVREALRRGGGREAAHTGDGVLATFDGPAAAIRCARDIAASADSTVGLAVRAGVHTGEIEIVGDELRGIALHIVTRICGEAGPGEVLVSRTVRELVMGSGMLLTHRTTTRLRGVPGEWELFAAGGAREAPPSPSAPEAPALADRFSLFMAHRAPRTARAVIRAEQGAVGLLRRRRS